jgi:hypothetical protein
MIASGRHYVAARYDQMRFIAVLAVKAEDGSPLSWSHVHRR